MKRIIVGTAGHIDHGKTKLIEALTGIDCDRWEEEKRRGITIDLGFAHLEANDLQIGFVDVPGHERFLDNALAGLGCIRLALLVVAADEGVKPQTREHLAICSLLRIPAALAVVTKSDLVTKDTLDIAVLEIEDLLAQTAFSGADVVTVSSVNGEGIDELRSRLVALARRFAAAPDPSRETRLPVDRVFALKGLGQVVTGTLTAGQIAAGDTLEALPGNHAVRVRSVQVHGEDRAKAVAGERTALRLTGVDGGTLARGTQLIAPAAYRQSKVLLAQLELLRESPSALEGSTPVRLHLATSEVLARLYPLQPTSIEPGAAAIIELRLARPVAVTRGDAFIIRRPSPPLTLGGGVILDPAWPRRRGRRLDAALTALSGGDLEAIRFWTEDAGPSGVSTTTIAQRLGMNRAHVEGMLRQLEGDSKVLQARTPQSNESTWLTPSAFRAVRTRAKKVLADHFGRDRLAENMSKAEAVERILPGKAAALADVYLDWLAAERIVVIDSGHVSQPGRTAQLSGEESRLAQQLISVFEQGGLTPPSPGELAQATGAKPQIIDGVMRYLQQAGKILQLPGGLLVAASAVATVRRELTASGDSEFGVGDFKQRFGLSRKWAIPLLEHLDSIGFTRRVGNTRQIVKTSKQKGT